jgi:hypothetical protein
VDGFHVLHVQFLLKTYEKLKKKKIAATPTFVSGMSNTPRFRENFGFEF